MAEASYAIGVRLQYKGSRASELAAATASELLPWQVKKYNEMANKDLKLLNITPPQEIASHRTYLHKSTATRVLWHVADNESVGPEPPYIRCR